MSLQDITTLEELESMRAEFLSLVSRELRTPLTSIRGLVISLLEDGSTLHPAGVREFYRVIVEQSARMCGLISNTLDLARIETGSRRVRCRWMPVRRRWLTWSRRRGMAA